MKGRELTRIALAQCSRSFCQSRLQRYNKVHGYNEAWAHLTLNCVESLPWDVNFFLFFFSFFTLPLHFWLYSFGVCVLLEAIYAHSLEKIKENYVGKQIPSFPWFSLVFPIFQYADRCLQKSGLSTYDPRDVAFPEKTRALFNSQPHWVIPWKQSDYCWLHNKMIIFLSFLQLSALPLMHTNISTSESWQTPLLLSRSHFRRVIKNTFFLWQGDQQKLKKR